MAMEEHSKPRKKTTKPRVSRASLSPAPTHAADEDTKSSPKSVQRSSLIRIHNGNLFHADKLSKIENITTVDSNGKTAVRVDFEHPYKTLDIQIGSEEEAQKVVNKVRELHRKACGGHGREEEVGMEV